MPKAVPLVLVLTARHRAVPLSPVALLSCAVAELGSLALVTVAVVEPLRRGARILGLAGPGGAD